LLLLALKLFDLFFQAFFCVLLNNGIGRRLNGIDRSLNGGGRRLNGVGRSLNGFRRRLLRLLLAAAGLGLLDGNTIGSTGEGVSR
jgi:hypothetical protein